MARTQHVINLRKTQEALQSMHKDVFSRCNAERKRHIDAHNRKTNVPPVNLTVGDFVLVRRSVMKGHKLKIMWMGPRRIVRVVSPLVYDVENILNATRETVHSKRLLLYRADMDGVEIDQRLLRAAEHSESSYQDVHSLRDIRSKNGNISIQVEWEGLPDEFDLTWEPLQRVHEDIPTMLREFLNTPGSSTLKTAALAQCQPL